MPAVPGKMFRVRITAVCRKHSASAESAGRRLREMACAGLVTGRRAVTGPRRKGRKPWESIYRKMETVSRSGGGTKELEAGIDRLEKNQEELRTAAAAAQRTADTANTNAAAAQSAAETAGRSAASAQNTANAALPKNYVTDAKNVTDNSRAMSAKENNAGMAGTLRNRIETVASERPGTVYQAYKTDEYVCGSDGKLLASLQLQDAGVYAVTGGIRYDTNANGTVHGNQNINMFLSTASTATHSEEYHGSNGACIPDGYQVCHLGTSSIMTVKAGNYVNLGVYGPPIKILRAWIRAVLIKKN